MKSFTQILLAAGLSLAPLGLFAQKGGTTTPPERVAIPGGSVTTSYVIAQPGSYYLAGNRTLTVSGVYAIVIQADGVTIDLNGNTLAGAGGAAAFSDGIHAEGRADIEVKNGTVTRFGSAGIGIWNNTSAGARITDVRVSENGYTGIFSAAENTQIVHCVIRENAYHGVDLFSAGGLISDCTITRNGQNGINLRAAGAAVNNVVSTSGYIGIWGGNEADAQIVGNQVEGNNTTGYEGNGGIVVNGRCMVRNNHVANNTSHGIWAPFFGSTLDGNTVVGTKKTGSNGAGFGYRFGGMVGENFLSNNRGYANAGGNYGPYIDAGGNFFK
jgi:hypothetical protein